MTMPSEVPPVPPVPPAPAAAAAPPTQTTFVAVADGSDDPPEPIKGLRRLTLWVLPANFSIFVLWGAVPTILLPQQLTLLDPAQKVANLAIVATIGAFAAMIAQPLAGQISDRTRSRFGRRAPWIFLGALAGGLSLVGLAFSSSLVGIAIAWTLVQITYNFAQGPLSAVMPDRVAVAKRGTFSALFGIGTMVGALGGQIVASLFFDSIAVGYVTFAVFALVILGLFLVFNPDYSSKNIEPEPFKLGVFLHTFWVNPVKYPDFFWAFTGRLLLFTGYFGVTGYQLYILTDYLGIAKPQDVIPLLGIISIVGVLIATLLGGPLSDRVGRRKPFIFVASLMLGAGFLLPWVSATLTSWMIMTFVAGLGFGIYMSVDAALMSEVLPSAKSFAKDLGVVNIAATMPQTLAPGIAGAIVLAFGYTGLFPIAIILCVLGALAIWPIKKVK